MLGTECGYSAMQCPVLSAGVVVPGMESLVVTQVSKQPCAMSGTELTYAVLSEDMELRDERIWSYAECGTELAYGATRHRY
eukprot:3941554-Rhodomonas_salina.7